MLSKRVYGKCRVKMEVLLKVMTSCFLSAFFAVSRVCAAQDLQDPAIASAAEALAKASPRAESDRTRPVYHFLPPAQWMNDICGAIKYKGWYHVLYQLNPYGDQWAKIHWGHTHRPGEFGSWYFNSGSWTGLSNNFIRISPCGQVQVFDWWESRACVISDSGIN